MKKRETELDILRIIALLAVILVHVCGIEAKSLPATDKNWQMLILLRALVTWEVPVYVMISGRFFLDPERNVTFSKIGKSMLRLITAFVLWNVVYQIYYLSSGAYAGLNWKGMLSQVLIGPYHFWYLHMLIWLYAIVPFLRKIAVDRKLMEYFIVLFLLFQFLTEYGPRLPFIGATLSEILGKTYYHFTLGFSGYYILGYYLYKYGVPDKFEIPLYILGAVILACTAGANVVRSVAEGFEEEWYTQYMLPNVIVESMAVYTFFVKRVAKIRIPEKLVNRISVLSDYSFGVYLIHALTIEFFVRLGLTPTMIHPLVMVPVFTVLVYAASHIAVLGLRKVPVIGRKMT